jgi:hypothetical protein
MRRSIGEAKPLNIDFDLYTDNDEDFKHQLLILIISNLNELQQAMFFSLQNNEVESFSKASHKVHATLVILEDPELDYAIAEMKATLALSPENNDSVLQKVSVLEELCNGIIISIEKELATM